MSATSGKGSDPELTKEYCERLLKVFGYKGGYFHSGKFLCAEPAFKQFKRKKEGFNMLFNRLIFLLCCLHLIVQPYILVIAAWNAINS